MARTKTIHFGRIQSIGSLVSHGDEVGFDGYITEGGDKGRRVVLTASTARLAVLALSIVHYIAKHDPTLINDSYKENMDRAMQGKR